jgi:hypothetical protein
MASVTPPCKRIEIKAFRGDRSPGFVAAFVRALADEKKGVGPGPANTQSLLYAGHAGVSVDGGATHYGFNPDGFGVAVWQMLDDLKKGFAYPGVVRDDSVAFAAAAKGGLGIVTIELVFPDSLFHEFEITLDEERRTSQYSYGFPNGDGECNCTTWLERLGLPLLTGRMAEFIGLPYLRSHPTRRFGKCV